MTITAYSAYMHLIINYRILNRKNVLTMIVVEVLNKCFVGGVAIVDNHFNH